MSEYQLTIEFAPDDLLKIQEAGQKVAIVKGSGQYGISNVIWVAFEPLEKNVLNWTSQYGLFASSAPVRFDKVLQPTSTQHNAEPGITYPFENGSFSPPESKSSPKNYSVENRMPDNLTFGLVQTVELNGETHGSSLVSASRIPTRSDEEFMPAERVFLFLMENAETGMMILTNRSQGLEVKLTSKREQVVHYDGEEGEFDTGPLKG